MPFFREKYLPFTATEYTHEGTRITVECDKATVEQAEKALE